MSEQVGRPLRRMLWHRLPVYFPNIKLIMEKPDKATYRRARWQGYLARVREPAPLPMFRHTTSASHGARGACGTGLGPDPHVRPSSQEVH